MPQSHVRTVRTFTRDKGHRLALLRNLVSSLFEHGKITTTLQKAKEASRLAEKVITSAKKGTVTSYGTSQKWLYNHKVTLPILYTSLRDRYADRQGGYTRVLRQGQRLGDGGDRAVLELVDGPGEIRFEMLAREIGRTAYIHELKTGRKAAALSPLVLQEETNWKLKAKVESCLKFRSEDSFEELSVKAEAHRDLLRAEPVVDGGLRRIDLDKFKDTPERTPTNSKILPTKGRSVKAGELLPAMAIRTPRKPTPHSARHDFYRVPHSTLPGYTRLVNQADGDKNAGGELPVGRSPLALAKGALGKRRLPVRRFGRAGDGFGG